MTAAVTGPFFAERVSMPIRAGARSVGFFANEHLDVWLSPGPAWCRGCFVSWFSKTLGLLKFDSCSLKRY
ncbi:hypothetical protein E5345_01855 [Propionibacterium sp. NM47_B9-13]|nr:hypothetical protein CP877_08725 [Cutibacterium modestum]TGY30041.1 hypothetical protein E5345_01855 [Propionibacterium sp. NM47_B9-13]